MKTIFDVLMQIPGYVLVFMLPVSLAGWILLGIFKMFFEKKPAPTPAVRPTPVVPASFWVTSIEQLDPLGITRQRDRFFDRRYDMRPTTTREIRMARETA